MLLALVITHELFVIFIENLMIFYCKKSHFFLLLFNIMSWCMSFMCSSCLMRVESGWCILFYFMYYYYREGCMRWYYYLISVQKVVVVVVVVGAQMGSASPSCAPAMY